jgi:hypothetical protein
LTFVRDVERQTMEKLVPTRERPAHEGKARVFGRMHGFGRIHHEQETHGLSHRV